MWTRLFLRQTAHDVLRIGSTAVRDVAYNVMLNTMALRYARATFGAMPRTEQKAYADAFAMMTDDQRRDLRHEFVQAWVAGLVDVYTHLKTNLTTPTPEPH